MDKFYVDKTVVSRQNENNKYYIGSSYYPEWWDEAEWENDFRKMHELGYNIVRMGEFAWSWFEPEEGKYNFEPMKRAVSLAEKYDIKVIMGTVTAICPPWLYKKYPEVKGGNEGGDYTYAGRKGNCLSSDIFLSYAEKITTEQAKALGNHPNIIGWQLDNEPGFPFVCYDKNCEKKFQKWLKEKYKTIDKLNDAWFTMMWSNVYNDFDEIQLPVHSAEGGWFPGMKLDYRRFFSDNFNNLLSMEAGILRQYIGKEIFLYTNWPGANWSVNCFDGAQYLDYAAWDNYVPMPYGEKYRETLRSCMEHDFDRRLSCGKNRFLIAEQSSQPNAGNIPEAVHAQTWLDVAHGAFGTIFFEWRTPTGGAEQQYVSVLGFDKEYGESEHVMRKLAKDINKVYPLIDGADTVSEIATLYSYQNSWATPGWVVDGPYDQDFFNIHVGFKNALQTNLDVIGIQDDFSEYKMIVAPNLTLITEEDAQKVISYVENGGTVVLNRDCARRDERNILLEVLEPGLFTDICSVKVRSEVSADEMQKFTDNSFSVDIDGESFKPYKNAKKIELCGADTLATYSGGHLQNKPAVTINKYGKGYAVYLGADCDDPRYYEAVARKINDILKIEKILDVEEGIVSSTRIKDGKEYIIAVNMTETEKKFKTDKKLYDVLNEKDVDEKGSIGGYDVLFAEIK